MMNYRRDWKALNIPLADVQAKSVEERCYRLSDQAVAVLLAISGYVHWPTRWEPSEFHTDADREFIRSMAAYIEHQLMSPNFCAEDEMIDVRQNPEEPCLLEKSTDGGLTWSTFADLRLCMPRLRRDPLTGRYNWTTDDITFYEFPDGPWVDNAPQTPVYGLPRPRTEATDDQACAAAASAAFIMRQTYTGIGENLLASVAASDFDRAGSIAFYLTAAETITGLSVPSIPMTIAVMAGLLATENGFSDNPLTDEDETRLKCILLENATNTDGSITFDWQAVWDAIDLDDPKQDHVRLMMSILGADFLNYAGAAADQGADCDACIGCEYFDGLETALGPKTHINGDVHPEIGGNWGTYQSSGGRTGGGLIHAEGDGVHQVINVLIDLGLECEITDSSLWLKVDVDPGAFVHLEWYYYAADGGLSGHGSLYNPVGGGLPWTKYDSVGTVTPTRFVVIDLWSDGASVYQIDDISVNTGV